MSIFKQKLNSSLGLEDDAPNVQVNIDVDETGMPIDNVSEDGVNTPEADEVEIIEDAQEIEEDNEVIEEMTEAADSLEAIYIAMESAQANGGLTGEAAVFASISVENIVKKYGVSAEDMGISLESFDDNRAQATTVSMESVGQALKDLWNTIVAKFQEMVKKIVDFYHKTIAAAPRIKRRAESIRKKARTTNGTAKETKMKTGLFNSLNIKGNVPTADALLNAVKIMNADVVNNKKRADIVADAGKLFSGFTASENNAGSTAVAENVARELGFNGVTVSGGSAKLNGVSISGTKVGTANAAVTVKDGLAKSLPGNKMFFCGAIEGPTRATAIDALRDYRCGIFTDKTDYKADKSKEKDLDWDVLTPAQVEGLCDQVIKNMEAIIDQKTQADKKLNAVKIMKKEGDKLIDKMKGDDNAKAKAEASRTLQVAVDVMRQEDSGKAAAVSYVYRTSKSVLAYCARSLGQYKKD